MQVIKKKKKRHKNEHCYPWSNKGEISYEGKTYEPAGILPRIVHEALSSWLKTTAFLEPFGHISGPGAQN